MAQTAPNIASNDRNAGRGRGDGRGKHPFAGLLCTKIVDRSLMLAAHLQSRARKRAAKRRSERGLTLIEVLIAVTLVSLLSVGILFAIRVGLNAMGRSNARLNENRRVAGAYRVLVQQIEGLIPVIAL